MGKVTRSLAGLVSIAALAKLLSRRRQRHETPAAFEPDPAAELRRKLDEARAAAPATETETGGAGSGAPTVEERREAVHAKAQEAIDAMRPEADGS